MRKLNTNQSIAVAAGLALLAYLFFGSSIMDLFGGTSNDGVDRVTQADQSGFVSEDLVVGEGELVAPGDTLTVHYIGTLTDGRVFDSSRDRNTPFTFTLGAGQVIRGWDEGLQGMRVGGTRLLVISPSYGYGATGAGPIPPDSTLIFEVEVLDN